MSGLATPPTMTSPLAHQPNEPAITDLLAALDESDDERDVAPSFYYQPNLEDSPEKPSYPSSNINNKQLTSPLIAPSKAQLSNDSSPTLAEGIDTHGMDYQASSRGSAAIPLSRSTSLVDPPIRESRPFARVASVPASILRKDRISDTASPEEDAGYLRRTGSDEGVLSPEVSVVIPTGQRVHQLILLRLSRLQVHRPPIRAERLPVRLVGCFPRVRQDHANSHHPHPVLPHASTRWLLHLHQAPDFLACVALAPTVPAAHPNQKEL